MVLATLPLFPAETLQPGAIRSGLIRPSPLQPREEKLDIFSSLVLVDDVLVEPTERPFLFVEGEPTEKSTLPPPLFPAAWKIRNSRWSQMKRSMSCERAV